MKAPVEKTKMTVQAQPQAWSELTTFTEARIGLGHAGVSLPTKAQLQFNLDHALARDAVNAPLNSNTLELALQVQEIPSIRVHSRAVNRTEYLQRPDYGRRLNEDSISALDEYHEQNPTPIDVALVLVDGLSAVAVQRYGTQLITALHDALKDQKLSCSPAIIVQQGRVAIGDEIGEHLRARAVVLIVGERPGLSAPDSLGIYYTYAPKFGLNDANRNCISNIRPAGLSIEKATHKALWLVEQSFARKLSGVALKDTSQEHLAQKEQTIGNFLLANVGITD